MVTFIKKYCAEWSEGKLCKDHSDFHDKNLYSQASQKSAQDRTLTDLAPYMETI